MLNEPNVLDYGVSAGVFGMIGGAVVFVLNVVLLTCAEIQM